MKILLFIASLMFVVSCAHKGHHAKKESTQECKEKKWKKMDTNNDGKLSKEEFINTKTEKFNEMDSNKDGSVTMEEKMAWKKDKKKKCKSCGS